MCRGTFEVSARLGESDFFVIEADEYDCAFFDKRSKFVHYRPRTLILNNLEFDHADIFDDLKAIQKQFHHLVRIVPGRAYYLAGKRHQLETKPWRWAAGASRSWWASRALAGEKLTTDASGMGSLAGWRKVGEVEMVAGGRT